MAVFDLDHLADPPPACGEQIAWVDIMAAQCAQADEDLVEAVISGRIAGALLGWRLDDATLWQRVRLRTRFLRKQRCASSSRTAH